MARVVGCHCDVISCELARRGLRRAMPAVAAESSACGHRSAVVLTSILNRGQFFLFCVTRFATVWRELRVRLFASGITEKLP